MTERKTRLSYLNDLVLGVSNPETEDDKRAIEIVQELFDEINPNGEFKINKPDEPLTYQTPWVRVFHSVFNGVEEIEKMAEQERLVA